MTCLLYTISDTQCPSLVNSEQYEVTLQSKSHDDEIILQKNMNEHRYHLIYFVNSKIKVAGTFVCAKDIICFRNKIYCLTMSNKSGDDDDDDDDDNEK